MEKTLRSDCPLNYGLEFFGDKWTLLIIRDMMLFNKRYFNEFLKSNEKISTNILRDRIQFLEKHNLITREQDPEHKQKIKHSLTQKSIDLLPVLIEILFWSEKQTDNLNPNRDLIFKTIKENKTAGLEKMTNDLIKKHLKKGSDN